MLLAHIIHRQNSWVIRYSEFYFLKAGGIYLVNMVHNWNYIFVYDSKQLLGVRYFISEITPNNYHVQ